jgi:hypothetical protein
MNSFNEFKFKKIILFQIEIAGERLWVELKQIVVGHFADSLMKHMIETQVAKHLGFDDDMNLNEFSRLYKLYETRPHDKPMSITMICSLLNSHSQVFKSFSTLSIYRNFILFCI